MPSLGSVASKAFALKQMTAIESRPKPLVYCFPVCNHFVRCNPEVIAFYVFYNTATIKCVCVLDLEVSGVRYMYFDEPISADRLQSVVLVTLTYHI